MCQRSGHPGEADQLATSQQHLQQARGLLQANPQLASRKDMQQVRETLNDLQQRLQVQLSQQQAASAAAPSDNAPVGSKAAAATSSANSTDGCNRSSAKPMVPQLLAALQQFWISRLSEQQQALLQPGATTQQPSSLWGRQHLQPPPPPPPKHFQDISTHAAAAAWVDLLRVTATASVQDESMAFAGDFTRVFEPLSNIDLIADNASNSIRNFSSCTSSLALLTLLLVQDGARLFPSSQHAQWQQQQELWLQAQVALHGLLDGAYAFVQRNHLGLVDYLQQLAVSANGGALVRERKLAFELLIKESDVEVCAEDLSGLRGAAEKWVQLLRLQLKSSKNPKIDDPRSEHASPDHIVQQIDNWLSGRVLPCVKGVRTLVGIDTWLGHVGRRLQAEAKVWRRISRVLLDAPSDPFLKSLFHHSAGVSHYTVCAALLETVAAHRAIREGFAKDLGQDFWNVIQCLFEMRLGPLGAPPHPKVMQDAWFMAALNGSREAQSLIRITRVLLADMARYMFRVSPLLPSLLPEAEAELPNLDRDASAVFQMLSTFQRIKPPMARFWFLKSHSDLYPRTQFDVTPRTTAEAVWARAMGRTLVHSSPPFRPQHQHTTSTPAVAAGGAAAASAMQQMHALAGAAPAAAQQALNSSNSSGVRVEPLHASGLPEDAKLQQAGLFDAISSSSDSEIMTIAAQQAVRDAEAVTSKAWDLRVQLAAVDQQLSAVAAPILPTDAAQQKQQGSKAKHKQKQQRRNQKLKQQQLRDDELLQVLKQQHEQLQQQLGEQRTQQLPLQAACRQQLLQHIGTTSWQKEFFSSISHPPPPGRASSCSVSGTEAVSGCGSDSSSTAAAAGDSGGDSSSGCCGSSSAGSPGRTAGSPGRTAGSPDPSPKQQQQQQNSSGDGADPSSAAAGSRSRVRGLSSSKSLRGHSIVRTFRSDMGEQRRETERQQPRSAQEARAALTYDWGGCRPWHAQRAKQLTMRQQQLSRVAALQADATSALAASHGLQRQVLGSAGTHAGSLPADSASAAAAAKGQLHQRAEQPAPGTAGIGCEETSFPGGSSIGSGNSIITLLQLQARSPHFRSISWQYAAQQKHRFEFGVHRSLFDHHPDSPPAANALDHIMHLRVQCQPASSNKQQQQPAPLVVAELGQQIAAAEAEVQELCAGSKLLQELVSSRCRRHLADSSRLSKKKADSTSSAGSAPQSGSLQAPGLSGPSVWGEELVGSSAVQGREGLQGEDELQGVLSDEAETQEDSLQGSDSEAGGSVSFGSSSAGSGLGCWQEREQQEGRNVAVARTRQLLWEVMQQLKPAACHWYETGAAHHHTQQQKQQSDKQQQQQEEAQQPGSPGEGASSEPAVAVPKCSSQVLWRAITCSLASDLLLVPPSIRDLMGNGWAAGAGRLGAGRDVSSVGARMLLVQYARAARQQFAQRYQSTDLLCSLLTLQLLAEEVDSLTELRETSLDTVSAALANHTSAAAAGMMPAFAAAAGSAASACTDGKGLAPGNNEPCATSSPERPANLQHSSCCSGGDATTTTSSNSSGPGSHFMRQPPSTSRSGSSSSSSHLPSLLHLASQLGCCVPGQTSDVTLPWLQLLSRYHAVTHQLFTPCCKGCSSCAATQADSPPSQFHPGVHPQGQVAAMAVALQSLGVLLPRHLASICDSVQSRFRGCENASLAPLLSPMFPRMQQQSRGLNMQQQRFGQRGMLQESQLQQRSRDGGRQDDAAGCSSCIPESTVGSLGYWLHADWLMQLHPSDWQQHVAGQLLSSSNRGSSTSGSGGQGGGLTSKGRQQALLMADCACDWCGSQVQSSCTAAQASSTAGHFGSSLGHAGSGSSQESRPFSSSSPVLGCFSCGAAQYCSRACADAAKPVHNANCGRLQALAADGTCWQQPGYQITASSNRTRGFWNLQKAAGSTT